MFEDLKPLLSYEYCARCRECCVFRDAAGVWTPRVTPAEAAALMQVSGRGPSILVPPDRLKLIPSEIDHQCVFLDRGAYRCTVYASRPDECRLYPFLLSSEKDAIRLYAHMACPFVWEKSGSREWTDYLAVLRAFFSRTDIRRYICDNRAIYPDYSPCADQLMTIADARTVFPEGLLRERGRLEGIVGRGKHTLSAYAFANIFAWQNAFDFIFEEIDGHLCVFAWQPVGAFLYLPPLGAGRPAKAPTINKVFDRLRAYNRGGGLTRIENVGRDDCAAFDSAQYVISQKGSEYIYTRQDIAGLRGNALKSKRHDVNLVERTADPRYRPYVPSDREACRELFDCWLDRKLRVSDDGADTLPRMMLEDARSVHACLWDGAHRLGLEGRVVEVKGQVAAYTFGCHLNEEVFCVLAEVADPKVPGLASYIFRAFADDAAVRPYRYLNTMDDYGLPAIARAKMSWRPVALEPVFTATEKEGTC